MNAEELLQAGRLEESLASLQQAVRNDPSNPASRVFLFQLFCVLGQWQRALTQLDVVASVSSDHLLLANIFRPVIQCEMLRAEVFAGKHSPMLFGEPSDWMGRLIQANAMASQGNWEAAAKLRDEAFDAAPPTPAKINDQPCEWIADADPRLGPIVEAIIEGKYYWVPFCRIQRIHLEAPSDLRDLIWAPVHFLWTNGGETPGHIPTRYPGSENSPEPQIRLGRKTDWEEKPAGYVCGAGQRLLATDQGEHPLLECRKIEMTAPA